MSAVIEINQTTEKSFFNYPQSVIFYPETDGKPMAETDKHRKLIINLTEILEIYFSERPDIYVSGNIMFYYLEGEPQECVSPDVMVCFGVAKGDRRTYKVWEENDVVPSIIIEIASRSTFKHDRTDKRLLYEQLGVKEYYIFNPEYPKTLPAFIAFKRNEFGDLTGAKIENGKVFSEILGLELVDTGETLRLFNPQVTGFLPTFKELNQEVGNLKFQAEMEAKARLKAEAEIEKLKAELAKLKNE